MPSQDPIPTTQALVDAYHTGVGLQDRDADRHDGSHYDHLGGPSALLWKRLLERLRAGSRENYQAFASRRLDQHIERRFQLPRQQDTLGQGSIEVYREAATAGAGWFRVGTRFLVGAGGSSSKIYQVAANTEAAADDLTATVPVRATEPGPDSELSTATSDGTAFAWLDPLWDNSWGFTRIDCGPGTLRATDPEYQLAARKHRFDSRVGYPEAIEAALRALGATQVELFPSDYAGDALDGGLNMAVVGDDGFETSAELLRNCRLALDGITIAGTAVQAVPMTRVVLGVTATVRLFDLPARFDTLGARAAARGALLEYFRTRQNPFIWQVSAMRGVIFRAVRNISEIEIETSVPEPTLAGLFSSPPLSRFVTEPYSVVIHVLGPGQ